MIKFFRNIRKKLLTDNKFSKYLLYAIGEILLVMVGILLALQVNNWNEQKIKKKTEIRILTEIRADLIEAEKIFTSRLEIGKKVLRSKQVLSNLIDNDKPWDDSLQIHFNQFNYWQRYTINQTAYNSLENWGINNISSDSIRRQIASIFQTDLSSLELMEKEEREIQLGTYNDIVSIELDWSKLSEVKPVNYNEFLKLGEFSHRLKAFKAFTSITHRQRVRILENIKHLRKNLTEEIDRLNK